MGITRPSGKLGPSQHVDFFTICCAPRPRGSGIVLGLGAIQFTKESPSTAPLHQQDIGPSTQQEIAENARKQYYLSSCAKCKNPATGGR